MRREVFEVIEAARSLQVQLAPSTANPRNVALGGDRKDFPDRLFRLAKALELFDRAGAASLTEEDPDPIRDPTMDAAKLKLALDSVFRWMKSVGINVDEPHNLVCQALSAVDNDAKPQRVPKPVPRFTPNGFKKSATVPGIIIGLAPVAGEKVTWESLAKKERLAQMTEDLMGAAAPSSRRA